MSDRKLKKWQSAGVIDGVTADRIRAYEADQSRPMGLWALIGLGALAIVLGIISVVAANWDDIPGMIRLSVHLALIVGILIGIYLQKSRDGFLGLYLKDVQLLIVAALGLTFFGHLGQVYQTSSPLWQPLLSWMILFSPVLLLTGRGWLVSLVWMAGILGTAIAHFGWMTDQHNSLNTEYIAAITSVPAFALLLATGAKFVSSRDDFWNQLARLALSIFVISVSIKLIGDSMFDEGIFGKDHSQTGIAILHLAIWLLVAMAVYLLNKSKAGIAIAAILSSAGIINLLSSLAQTTDSLASGILFIGFWASIAWAATFAGWRNIFRTTVTVIALRLIILSFELASDLLSSGLGLIMAGIITIVIALGAYRFSKAFAPPKAKPEGSLVGEEKG